MHRSKLFRALVIGGGMTAASLVGCGDEATNADPVSDEQSQSAGDDTAESSDNTSGETAGETDPDSTETSDNSGTDSETDVETDPETDPGEEDANSADGEPLTCFCGDEPQCCEEVDGESQVVDGFECCWGTSC
ncbi:MAG: hypothetical protein HOI23_04035 [Deltaproteobacteria bacterium]|jgi:hypothetical protein|nr:hypothetical protein [Deltaproteobacteria bacterium]MBT6432590.1 hypothetical protein [Deltaproteobacteria bacterium]